VAKKADKKEVMAKQKAFLKGEKPPVTLTKEDCRWWENLALKEKISRTQFESVMQGIQQEYDQMMTEVSARVGVDLRKYKVDWIKGTAVPAQDEKLQE
jgi:hypothetical protein